LGEITEVNGVIGLNTKYTSEHFGPSSPMQISITYTGWPKKVSHYD